VKELTEMTDVEQVCWLALRDGGRVAMDRPRSQRSTAKIMAARVEGAINGQGYLTSKGRAIAMEANK
jgi:hypothetical protein